MTFTFDHRHASNVKRPQLQFPDKVDNSLTAVFVPLLKTKPNATVPLDLVPKPIVKENSNQINSHVIKLGFVPETIVQGPCQYYDHPYQKELEQYEPTDDQLKTVTVTKPKPYKETNLVFVDDKEKLQELKNKLDNVDEIAIDLEAHSYRTYDSFTCLMQISTRSEDYIVDALVCINVLFIIWV